MGSIRQRHGIWYLDAYVNGHRVRRAVGPYKADAQRELRELQRADRLGFGYVALDKVVFGYLSALRVRAKPTSVAGAEVHAEHLFRYFGPDFNVATMDGPSVDAFVKQRLESVQPASVNGSIRVLRAALRRAVEDRVLAEMPCRIRELRVGRKLPSILTGDDVDALLGVARPPVDLAILLAARAGLRQQEILHLAATDVDLVRREVRVTAKPGWSPKSHHERAVPIGARLLARLQEHVCSLTDQGRRAWVFPGYEGMHLRSIHRQVSVAFRAAGLYHPEARPGLHQLRRTWASMMLARGVDLVTLMELGGWSNLATVERYLASTTDRKRAAIEALDRS